MAAGGCWKGTVQPVLLNRHRSRARALPDPLPRALGSSPTGTGISGLRPELLKAPWVPVLLCCRRRWRFQELPGTNTQSDGNPSPSSNNSQGAGNAKNPPQERPQSTRPRFGVSKPPLHPPSSIKSSADRIKLYPSIKYSVHAQECSSPFFPRRQHGKAHGPRRRDGDFLGGKMPICSIRGMTWGIPSKRTI